MFKYILGLTLVSALSLTGCTTYQPDGLLGGFSETPLARNVYEIHAGGTSLTRSGSVRNIALVRAAELTLEKGYSSFIVVDQDSYMETETYTTPGQFNATTNVMGNTAYTSGMVTGGGTEQINKPRTDLVVRMYMPGEDGSANALDPMEIIRTIGPQVGYDGPYAR